MKIGMIKTGITWIVLSAVFLSCSSDDDAPSSDTTKTEIEDDLKSSSWIITKYIDSDEDELYHYDGYEFAFEDGNVLTASKGGNSYTGTWSITNSNSSSSSSDDLDFNIFFSSPEELEELTDDWDILSNTSMKIELIDISGSSGEIDYLTFEKK